MSSCVPKVQSDIILCVVSAGEQYCLSEKWSNLMLKQILVNLVNKLWFECEVHLCSLKARWSPTSCFVTHLLS